jgi:hypothetical protein
MDRPGTCIILDKKYNIANSSCHFGSYGSIWTGPSPNKYYMDLRSFGPYNIFLVTDRSIYCHMTLSAMNYLLYMGTFSRKGNVTPEKFITVILTDLSMNFYPMIYIAFRRQHLCPFHFHLFCFEANINIQFLELHHPFRDTYCSIIQVFFHYFCLKFVCRLTNIGTFISCLFLGGTYFKSMFC